MLRERTIQLCSFVYVMLCNTTKHKRAKNEERRTGDGDADFLDGRVVFLLKVIIGRDVFDLFVVEALGNVLLLFHDGCESVCIRVIGELKMSCVCLGYE